MSTPQEKSKPTEPKEKETEKEVEGRESTPPTTIVPQDGTTVPQD